MVEVLNVPGDGGTGQPAEDGHEALEDAEVESQAEARAAVNGFAGGADAQ